MFESAGLTPISFKTEPRAVAICVLNNKMKNSVLIINVKDSSTILSMAINGVVYFTSTISMGKNSVIDVLKKVPMLNQTSLYKMSEEVFSSDETKNAETFNALMNIFSVIRDSVEKFVEFYQDQCEKSSTKSCEINKVVLCGCVSAIPGFSRYISSSLEMDVEIANVWGNVFDLENFIPSVKFTDSLDFSAAIGVALGENK